MDFKEQMEKQRMLFEESILRRKNSVSIYISIYGNNFSQNTVKKFFYDLFDFPKESMEIFSSKCEKSQRYKEEVFKSNLQDENFWGILAIRGKDGSDVHYMRMQKRNSCAYLMCNFKSSIFYEKEFREKFEEIIMEMGACFAYAVNDFDTVAIQHPRDIYSYEGWGLTEEDFNGIGELTAITSGIPGTSPVFDPSAFPGRSLHYDLLNFNSAPYMWFGPDYSRFFDIEFVKNFSCCEENTEIADGFRRICLWKDINDYSNMIFRERQWQFRIGSKMDEIIKELNRKPFIPKDQNSLPDPSMVIKTGKFEHGGTKLITTYVNSKGKPCSMMQARAYIVCEMLDDKIIHKEKFKL
jgi:hypothetical protein